ncbi:MAG: hypothetical protein Q9162_006239 [Coniocarpon cinnabarinum]
MASLKSTYQPPPTAPPSSAPLPPGWTEHTAPTGHKYYYNTATKTSTYTRPNVIPTAPTSPPASDFIPLNAPGSSFNDFAPPQPFHQQPIRHAVSDRQFPNPRFQRRGPPPDRPKSKHELPGYAPWVLVKTKLGRRFVHNTETGESSWKISGDLRKAIEEFDEREKRLRERGTGANSVEIGQPENKHQPGHSEGREGKGQNENGERVLENIGGDLEDPNNDSYDELIEEEVSASENGDEDAANAPNKRRRLSQNDDDTVKNDDDAAPQNLEFTEDDIAAQLAAMGQSLDPPGPHNDDDGEGDGKENHEREEEDEEQGLELTPEDAQNLFHALLTDNKTNPYTTWKNLIASPQGETLINDDRYTLLPTMRARESAFLSWSQQAIARNKASQEKQARLDPRVPFLELLAKEASVKLYWAEFRRKFRKEGVMNTSKLQDKDREKLYREWASLVKRKSSREREDELWDLFKDIPASDAWNRDVDAYDSEELPQKITSDIHWAVVKPEKRARMVKEFIRRLPYKDELDALGEEDERDAEYRMRREERRKARALEVRERQVLEQKRRAHCETRHGREALLLEEEELRRAMRVSREGLKDALEE